MAKKKVVVVGGGIAGLKIAQALDALLVTNSKQFVFLPQLQETIHKNPKFVTKDITKLHDKIMFGKATNVDTKKKILHVGGVKIPYDYLVLAMGGRALTPVPGSEKYAHTFYTIDDAKEIRKLLPKRHIVVVGAGPTGVEVAIELAKESSVTLLQRQSMILPTFMDDCRMYARKKLMAEGVTILTEQDVTKITKNAVHTKTGKHKHDLCIWAAGVGPNLVKGVPTGHGILVDKYLKVFDAPNVFAAGDCAQTGAPLTAQAALQEADIVIKNIRRSQLGLPLKEYHYKERGKLLALGKNAYLEAKVKLKGSLAAGLRHTYYAWQFNRY